MRRILAYNLYQLKGRIKCQHRIIVQQLLVLIT
nr:MAG TPA: hypothetical protein [Caudoviricetes sp.]